jgi:fluoride exporter
VNPRITVLFAVAIGGAIGALARAGLSEAVTWGDWPYMTLGVNLVGTVLLAALGALIAWRPHLPHWLNPLVGVGICGSLTTFSTMQLEAVVAVRDGLSAKGVIYIASSVLLGLAAVIATRAVARKVIT